MDTGTHGHIYTRIQGHRNTRIKGHKGIGTQGTIGAVRQGHMNNTVIQGKRDTDPRSKGTKGKQGS